MFFTYINTINILVMLEILILTFIIAKNQKKRSHFLLRIVLCFLLSLTYSYFFPIFDDPEYLVMNIIITILLYASFIVVVGIDIYFCFDVKYKSAVFIAVGGYALQHVSSEVGDLINPLLYSLFSNINQYIIMYSSMIIIDFVSIAILIIFLKHYEIKDAEIKTNKLLYFIIGVIFSTIVLSTCSNIYYDQLDSASKNYLLIIFNFLCAVFLVYILIRLLSEKKLENELVVVEELMKEEAKQYEFSKQNIEAINVKCHDLKYRIRALKDEKKLKSDSLDDLENNISIYDSYFKTGNEALDVLLTEKSLFCKQNNIDLTVIADGHNLSFMSNYEIYSLFGNALSNAIEAVKKVEQREKRNISFTLSKKGNYIALHIENYFTKLNMDKGKIITSKKDIYNHGFGIISMRHIAEKYQGNVVLSQDSDIFITDITLLIHA